MGSIRIAARAGERETLLLALEKAGHRLLSFDKDGFVVDNPDSESDDDVEAKIRGIGYLLRRG